MGLLSVEPETECMPEAYCMISNSRSPGKDFSVMKEGFWVFLLAFLSVKNPAPLQGSSKQEELSGNSPFETV